MEEQIQKQIKNLKEKRDELQVKLDLGKKEVKSRWEEVENQLNDLEHKAEQFKSDAQSAGEAIGEEFRSTLNNVENQLNTLKDKYIG